MPLVYNPSDGLKNKVSFPTAPANEDEARKQVQDMFDQVSGYINSTVEPSLTNHTINTSHIPYAVATGSANTYAVTLTPAPSSYTDGMALCVKINADSTGASTINANNLGAKTIKDSLGNNIVAGGLKANTPYTLRYESSSGNFIVQGKGGGGTATAAQILTGYSATVDSGAINGTMPNRAGDNASIGSAVSGTTLKLTAPTGYYDGVDDKVTITDPNFTAGNIKSGVPLLGLTGTYTGKQFASGTGTSDGSYNLTVTGLTFTPSIILVWKTASPLNARMNYYATLSSTEWFYGYGTGVGSRAMSAYGGYVNATGFKAYAYDITGAVGSVSLGWMAIE